MQHSKKLGLVLGGGGGKGAYQIGVWKYLKEIGLDKDIKVVSGTSVGALNAVLFSLGDYELAEDIWLNRIEDKILSVHKFQELELPEGFENLGDIVVDVIRNGLFSREGLVDIFNEYIDFNRLKNMDKRIYATCTQFPEIKGKHFLLNGLEEDKIRKILLASSAIPVAYKFESIDGLNYVDGGLICSNNVPVTPINEEKCDGAVVISLGNMDELEFRQSYNTVVINPSETVGFLTDGTLNFTKEKAKKLIALGYEDASTIFGPNLILLKKEFLSTIESLSLKDVIPYFRQEKIKNLLLNNSKYAAVLTKEKTDDGCIFVNACIFNRETNEIKNSVTMWKTKSFEKDLSDAFGDKSMIILA